MTKRKLNRLLTQEENIARRTALQSEEKEARATLMAVWWDVFLRFAIPYLASAIHDCYVFESTKRHAIIASELKGHSYLNALVRLCTELMSDWDEGREDLLVSERRSWDILSRAQRSEILRIRQSTISRVFKSFAIRKKVCEAYVQNILSRRPQPQIVIPRGFWEAFAASTGALMQKEQGDWNTLWFNHQLDSAFWCEMAGRRRIRFMQQSAWIDHMATFTLTKLSLTFLSAHDSYLRQSRRAYVGTDLIAAANTLARWWRGKKSKSSRLSKIKQILEGYRPVSNKRIVEYHDQLDRMLAIANSKPTEASAEEWELVTRLRALERGHEMGASCIWLQYVTIFNRIADQQFCIPKWRQAPLVMVAQAPGTAEYYSFEDTQLHGRHLIANEWEKTVLRLRRQWLESLQHNNPKWAGQVQWLCGEEQTHRTGIIKEECLWRRGAYDAMIKAEPYIPEPLNRQQYIDQMLLWERHRNEPAPQLLEVTPPPLPPVEPSLPQSILRVLLAEEGARRHEAMVEYEHLRENIIMRYVWEAILGPNYWHDREAIVSEEAEAYRRVLIGFHYDSDIVRDLQLRNARVLMAEDEAYRRRHLAGRCLADLVALLTKLSKELTAFAEYHNAKPMPNLVKNYEADIAHIKANEALRNRNRLVALQIVQEEITMRSDMAKEERMDLESILSERLPPPFTCSMINLMSLIDTERDGRDSIRKEATSDLSYILVDQHRSWVQHSLWPEYTVIWLRSLTSQWSEPRLLSNTIVSSLTMYRQRLAHIERVEVAQRSAIEELQHLTQPAFIAM